MSTNRFAEEIIRLVDLEVEDASPHLLAGIRAQVAAAMESVAPSDATVAAPSPYSDEEPLARRIDARRDDAAYLAFPHLSYDRRRMFRDGWDACVTAQSAALDPRVRALALRRAREGKPISVQQQERVCEALLDVVNAGDRLGPMATRRAWAECEHEWRDAESQSQSHNAVVCVKCKCPGDRNRETGDVYWPAT